jgi:nucleoid-associated protein YgaU
MIPARPHHGNVDRKDRRLFDGSGRPKQPLILVLGLLLTVISFSACGTKNGPDTRATPSTSGTAIPMMTIVTPTPGLPPAPGATPTEPTQQAQNDQNGQNGTYTVQPGDTLFSIASKFNVTIDALMQANSITDPTALQANQVLVIP